MRIAPAMPVAELHDDVAASSVEARGKRGVLAEVSGELENPDAGIRELDRLEPRERAVAAAVVDEDDLGRLRQRRA